MPGLVDEIMACVSCTDLEVQYIALEVLHAWLSHSDSRSHLACVDRVVEAGVMNALLVPMSLEVGGGGGGGVNVDDGDDGVDVDGGDDGEERVGKDIKILASKCFTVLKPYINNTKSEVWSMLWTEWKERDGDHVRRGGRKGRGKNARGKGRAKGKGKGKGNVK